MTPHDDKEQHPSDRTPILDHKHYDQPTVFTAENLLREARRQKDIDPGRVPAVCVLDPDGDLEDYLHATGRAQYNQTWACYHTRLSTFIHEELTYGIVGRVVGAPFAVLVAEELLASGCRLIISVTSAGQILPVGNPPYFMLIERALRDEGTSYHYLPPAPYSELCPALSTMVRAAWSLAGVLLHAGASWTTDAPFRETEAAIAAHRAEGILAVEMEAAALYALATAKQHDIVCFAHITNQMAQTEGDFEKGIAQGSIATLEVIGRTAHAWLSVQREFCDRSHRSREIHSPLY
jgi:uridine phosphorylase